MLLADLVPWEELKNIQLGWLLGLGRDSHISVQGLIFEHKGMVVFPLSSVF